MNMTPKEHLHYGIPMPAKKLEQLVDSACYEEKASTASDYLTDAEGCFPGEDALELELANLRQLAGALRGKNKETLIYFIGEIEDWRVRMNQESEHGADLIRQALKELQ